jgi:hypothetical protein
VPLVRSSQSSRKFWSIDHDTKKTTLLARRCLCRLPGLTFLGMVSNCQLLNLASDLKLVTYEQNEHHKQLENTTVSQFSAYF